MKYGRKKMQTWNLRFSLKKKKSQRDSEFITSKEILTSRSSSEFLPTFILSGQTLSVDILPVWEDWYAPVNDSSMWINEKSPLLLSNDGVIFSDTKYMTF